MNNQNWKDIYSSLCLSALAKDKLPVIGVLGSGEALIKEACVPVQVAGCMRSEEIDSLLDVVEALLLTKAEDDTVYALVQCALDRQIPVLAAGEGHKVLMQICADKLVPAEGALTLPYKSVRAVPVVSQRLCSWLVAEALEFKKARMLHQRILSLDTHCDTPMFFDQDIHFDQRDSRILVDAHKMREGHVDACIMAAYLEQQGRSDAELKAATLKCDHLLDGIEQRIGACEGVGLARTPDDLYRLKLQGKLAIMKGIENGYAIGKDIANVERYRRRGVVYMTLCHNGDNDICDSAVRTNHEHSGLSKFGYQVVEEMNRVGMMVDLSHGGEKSFWDALEASKTPIVCSHASTKALCDHPRNLNDEQIKALSKVGGVMQITMYPGFLRLDGKACIEDAVEHLKHAVDVAGIDSVGIGTDFDGDGGIPGMADASEAINFTRRLLRERFSEADIRKIWGENFLRVMRQVQEAGCIN